MSRAENVQMPVTPADRLTFWLVAAGLCVYCGVLTVSAGDFGFEGDDWWVFSWPYWNSFPRSVWAFARDCLRPVEGVYWICLFECFGFNRIAFHVCSLLLAASGCILFGLCLATAFPERRAFAAMAALFAFFLPTVSSLTYVLATDNSRLSLLLFWASALAFQRWALRGASWAGLGIPVVLYALSFFTYEAASLLIFVVPLLVLPAWERSVQPLKNRDLMVRLGTGIVAAFSIAVAVRFLFLGGGAVEHRQLLPPWDLLWSYPALLLFYLAAPFVEVAFRPGPWLLGAAVTPWVGSVLFFAWKEEARPTVSRPLRPHGFYPPVIGLGVLVLGMLPYQLAGYGSITPKLAETALIKWGLIPDGYAAWFNFNWSGRIYSAASFGIAILLAWLVTIFQGGGPRAAAAALAAMYLGAAAALHVDLGNDWKEAGRMRNQLMASLVSGVPGVQRHTGFVFLDLECSWGRAAVFRGWNGLRELMCMIYRERQLGAWYLYPHSWAPPNHLFPQATVSPEGFSTRAMRSPHATPRQSVLILRRNGSELVPVDAIVAGDGSVPTGIAWKGIHRLVSHTERIRGWWDLPRAASGSAKNPRDSGLLTSLGLGYVTPRDDIPNGWEAAVLPDNRSLGKR